MKKLITWLLLAAMATTALVSCSDGKDGNTDKESSADTTGASETEATDTRLYADLPDVTFDGSDFKTAHWVFDTGAVILDMTAEAQTGDLVNDAVYKRNMTIEDRYKVKFNNQYLDLGDLSDKYKQMVLTGDHTWDAVFIRTYELPTQFNDGVLLDLNTVPYMELSNPWYDQDSVEGLSIAGVLPAVASDINLADNLSTACVMFNKSVATNNNINSDDFYQYVLDGSWTIDKMYEIGKKVSSDTDGDGEHKLGDTFGIIGQWDPTYMLFFGSGERYVTSDSDGIPQLAFGNERSYAVCEKIINLMNDEVNYLAAGRYTSDSNAIVDAFSANQCLFMIDRLYRTDYLRNMQSDYGILPIPKYDEDQDQYYNFVSIHNSTVLTVPKTNDKLEMTGIILEALACESRYTVVDTYYEVVLQEKLTRDASSYQMIEIIFNNRVWDIGETFAVGGFNNKVLSMAQNQTNMTSTYKSLERMMQKALDKLVEKAEKMF